MIHLSTAFNLLCLCYDFTKSCQPL